MDVCLLLTLVAFFLASAGMVTLFDALHEGKQ